MTQLIRIATLSVVALAASASIVSAQRSRGTMGTLPTVTTQPSPPPVHPTPWVRGTMSVPRGPTTAPARPGDLPRIIDGSRRRDGQYGATRGGYSRGGYSNGGYSNGGHQTGGVMTSGSGFDRRPRYSSRPYTRYGVGSGCVYSCFSIGGGIRTSRFFTSFSVGYPFSIPIFVPYFLIATPDVYVEPRVEERYVEEAPRAASKLIVVGGSSGGGGDALTVESAGDSVKLNWLPNSRQAREVKLFVADSAQRQLATRIASPAAPSATFEIATLSAPVAFAGVSVTFTDGVISTTVVPYRGVAAGSSRR